MVIVHVRMQRARTPNLTLDDPPVTTTNHHDTGDFVLLDKDLYTGAVSEIKRYVIFRFESPLYFATLDLFKSKVSASLGTLGVGKNLVEVENPKKVVILNAASKCDIDIEHVESSVDNDKDNENELHVPIVTTLSLTNVSSDTTLEDNDFHKQESCDDVISSPCIVVDCTSMSFIDTGGAKLLGVLQAECAKKGARLLLAGCSADVRTRLVRVLQCATLVSTSLYPSVQDALVAIEDDCSIV